MARKMNPLDAPLTPSGTGAPAVRVGQDSDKAEPSRLRKFLGWLLGEVLDRIPVTILVFLVILGHVFGVAPFPLVNRLFYDARLQARPVRRPHPDVALVAIDDEAIQELGRWPWPRSVYARLVRALDRAGARVIALDVAFLEPDSYSARDFMATVLEAVDVLKVSSPALTELLGDMGDEADTDAQLAKAIEEADAEVVLGYYFHDSAEALGFEPTPGQIRAAVDRIEPSGFVSELGPGPPVPETLAVAWLPHPPIAQLVAATNNLGFQRYNQDTDSAVRRTALMLQCDGLVFPSLSVAAARAYRGQPELRVKVLDGAIEGIEMGARVIPTDPLGGILINYHGPPPVFPRYSAADVIFGRVGREELEDRLLVVGGTASGIRDDFLTPMGMPQNSIDIRATVIDNILQGDSFRRTAADEALGVIILLAIGAFGVVLVPAVNSLAGLFVTGLGCAGVISFDANLFLESRTWIPVVPGVLILVLIYGVTLFRRYWAERSRRRQVEGTFGRYVAPTVVKAMLSDPDKLQLGGEERRLTVLFSDLAGFTATTERLSPAEMVALMCEYFEEMTAKIYDQEGMLKEYVGDEIMALFGAPVFHQDHALRACRAALAMRDRLKILGEEWQEQGRPPLTARWGVNTGTMLVGNLGSSYRFSYGALGDAVNLGSRLEGLNSQYGTRILIGEETAAEVKDILVIREVDAVRVKGKSKVVRVHELLGEAGTPAVATWAGDLETYASGLARYREGKFARAQELFEKVLARRPDDGPARTMRERCQEYVATHPGDDWDGVYTALKK